MGELVDLDEYRPGWLVGLEACGKCGHVSVGVCHVDKVSGLECPRCGAMAVVLIPDGVVDFDGLPAMREQFPERF